MPSSSATNTTMFLTDEDDTFKISRTVEISQRDSTAVTQLYQKYLKKLRENPDYSSLSEKEKIEFDDKYKAERFSDYKQFQKSPYGKLNMFSEAETKKTSFIILKFKSEKEANEFFETLKKKGIMCKVLEAPTNHPALRM